LRYFPRNAAWSGFGKETATYSLVDGIGGNADHLELENVFSYPNIAAPSEARTSVTKGLRA
jgi:hypothetical protein